MSLLSLSCAVGHPMCHTLSGSVGRPSLSLFAVLWDIPFIPSPPQQGRPSLPHFSHMMGRPSIPYSGGVVGHPFRGRTMHYWDVPPIAHSAAWWEVPCVPSYRSQMGRPFYCPFSRMVGRPSCALLGTNGTSLPSPTLTDGTSHSVALPIAWDVPRVHYSVQMGRPCRLLLSQMGHPMLNRRITHLRTKANGQVDRLD
jgi:hypothetical protein